MEEKKMKKTVADILNIIKENNENANILAIDYDASASKINQENRIKLMLASAKERLKEQKKTK